MLNREDMNKYNTTARPVSAGRAEGELSQTAGATALTMGGMVWKAIKTVLFILCLTGLLVFLSVASFILSFRDIEPPNLSAMSLNFSSFIYLDNPDGTSTEYLTLHANEDRVWVPLNEIPQAMIDAQIAIEDKRFMEHNGVDWRSTGGAVVSLLTNTPGRGGSTLTQQLIKNLTDQNQVSVLRKVREIFTALNMEKKYSKDEILLAYLNVVNYGNQCQGVQAAANSYFGKDIIDCSIAECALIAGITQNPWQYNPFIFPEDAKAKGELVLQEMEKQEKITSAEYRDALAEMQAMTFGSDEEDEEDEEEVEPVQDQEKWNWYIETLVEDVISDIQESQNVSYDMAEYMLYNSGLEIHCAMDLKMQTDIEKIFLGSENMPEDKNIDASFFMMDYSGKVMAVVGSRFPKTTVRGWNNAVDGARQTGSSIKPISVYSVGLMTEEIYYGSVLKDVPIPEYSTGGDSWPANFSLNYEGTMNVDKAIEVSQNAPAAWLAQAVTPEACYDWLTQKLHFEHLTEEDSHSPAAMALGGLNYGATTKEMAAAFQIFGNGGVYHKPYTYNYVRNHDNDIILDNRGDPGEQVMSPEDATVMNKLLHRPTEGYNGTAAPQMSELNVDVFGKTGTTDSMYDYWFVGGTPFCVAAIWNGYSIPAYLEDSTIHKITWRTVMEYMINNYDWSGSSYTLSDNVTQTAFCRSSGLLAGTKCYDIDYGWFSNEKMPRTCNGGSDHIAHGKPAGSPSPSPSVEPSASPSISPSPSVDPSASSLPSPSVDPSIEPSDNPSSIPDEPTPTPPGPSEPPVTETPDIPPEPTPPEPTATADPPEPPLNTDPPGFLD